jgi:hypothetical protein
MLPTGIQFMKSNIRGPGAHLVERIAFLTVPFLSRLCFVLMLSGKYISDLYESEGEEYRYTNPSYFPNKH